MVVEFFHDVFVGRVGVLLSQDVVDSSGLVQGEVDGLFATLGLGR